MKTLDLDEAHLIGFATAWMLYGLYTSLFVTTLWLHQKLKGRSIDIVQWAVIVLFLLSTASIIVFTIDNYRAWVAYPGSAASYFNQEHNMIGPWKDTFLYTAGVVGDCLIVWRLYVVWSRSLRVIIAPVITLALYGICGAAVSVLEFYCAFAPRTDLITRIQAILTGGALISGLLTNLYTTSMIVIPLWWTDRQVRRISTYVENPRDYWYKEVIRSILESGSLYTAAVIATMVGSSVVTNGSTIFGYIDAIIVCIVPTLLVLLLHMNRVRAMERRPKQTAASTGIRFSPMGNFSSSASQTGLELLEIGQDGGDVSLNGENQA